MADLRQLDLKRAARKRVSESQTKALGYLWGSVVAALGDVEAQTLTYAMVERYADERLLLVRAQTVRREVQCIRRGLGLARKGGHRVPDIPAVEMADDAPDTAQAGEAHPLPVLSRWLSELRYPAGRQAQGKRSVLSWCQAVWVLYVGMRIEEARKMDVSWLAVEGGAIVLRSPGAARKTRDDHGQALHPCALEAIRVAIQHHGTGHTGPLWPAKHRRSWIGAQRAIGYAKTITARDLRHTFCSTHTMHGDLVATRDAMGHKSLQTTSRYAHGDLDRCRAALDALPDLLVRPDPLDLTPIGVGRVGAPGKPRRTCNTDIGVARFELAAPCSQSTSAWPVLQLLSGYVGSAEDPEGHERTGTLSQGPDPRPDPLTPQQDLDLAADVRDLLVAGRGAEVRAALTTAGLLPAIQETA